jgi:hypothetical protein
MQLVRNKNNFIFHDGNHKYAVSPHFIDPLLKRMNQEQLNIFVKQGNRIRVIRMSDGTHRLQSIIPGKGGGPISAKIAYEITKTICLSNVMGAGIGAAIATGGIGICAAEAMGIATGTKLTAGGASLGATAAVIIAGIETISLTVFALFMALPLP